MTLAELKAMRIAKKRPSMPVTITDENSVHTFCTLNGFPVFWIPHLENQDLTPFYKLPVWLIVCGKHKELADKLRKVKTELWITGKFGFDEKVSQLCS